MKNQLTKIADLTRTVQNVTHITARAYYGEDKFAFHSHTPYPEWLTDPFDQYADTLNDVADPIICIRTEDDFFFGAITTGRYHIVLGPVQDPAIAEDAFEKVACAYTDDPERQATLFALLKNTQRMSRNELLAMLISTNSMLHYADSGEEEPADSLDQRVFGFTLPKISYYNYLDEKASLLRRDADSYFADMIKQGDIDGMRTWMVNPLFSAGKLPLADDPLRNAKDNFIVVAGFLSTTALNGGLSRTRSAELLISAIQNVERMDDEIEILRLLSDLAKQYTEETHKAQEAGSKETLAAMAVSYIRSHLDTPLRTDEIAKALYVSRSHLSQTFAEETGQTLGKYIQNQKIEEAKKLLSRSEMSLSQISANLCFSSQSYFTRIFRETTGMTPKEYRTSRQLTFDQLQIG